MKYAKTFPLLTAFLFPLLIISYSSVKAEPTAYIVDLPLYDTPYNDNLDLKNPSMTQALQFSKAFYQFSHHSIQSFWGNSTDASLISIILFDTLATWLPLSNGSNHISCNFFFVPYCQGLIRMFGISKIYSTSEKLTTPIGSSSG